MEKPRFSVDSKGETIDQKLFSELQRELDFWLVAYTTWDKNREFTPTESDATMEISDQRFKERLRKASPELLERLNEGKDLEIIQEIIDEKRQQA